MDDNNFDINFYVKYYNDINIKNAHYHWINFGKNENRFKNINCLKNNYKYILKNFDWKFYVEYYKDLSKFDETEATKHWIFHGYYEKRICYDINIKNDLDTKTELNKNMNEITIEKRCLKIRLEPVIRTHFLENDSYHKMNSLKQFIEYFFPNDYDYIIVDYENKADIAVWNIYLEDNTLLRDNEINILISVENMNHWKFYKHYNKYGNYGNDKMNIYLYNHIRQINIKDNYIAIPMIHFYMNYYINNQFKIKPTDDIQFSNKRFCLMINKSGLNPIINKYYKLLSKIDKIDNISLYNNRISNKSCYNSQELINIFNKYKFIICIENSYSDGYITEKIFNCLYANTIPIYKGSNIISNYINNNRIININNIDDNLLLQRIKHINKTLGVYNSIINSDVISELYDNEEYKNKYVEFITRNLLSKSNI